MKNIRNGVFETNSSSSHSISILNNCNGMYDTICPNDDGNIILEGVDRSTITGGNLQLKA